VAEWLKRSGFTAGELTVTSVDLLTARELREVINRLALRERPPRSADVRLLNRTAGPAPVPQLRFDAEGHPRRHVRPQGDPVRTAFAAIAVDAIELITSEASVRVCAADDCGLRFLDASPKRNRQWCSMSRCGNRAKARAHYARSKSR
jgi:predicted RNA-binding Zn ribbon-like protein